MKVAGIGFRKSATTQSLRSALDTAGGVQGLHALATIADKATAPSIIALGLQLNLPVRAIEKDDLQVQSTLTVSTKVDSVTGVGSVSEAAALAACGPGSRLIGARAVSSDRLATAAIAVSETMT